MKTIILILSCCICIISGCSEKGMTNEEIIKEIRKCKDAGLDYDTLINRRTKRVVGIQCN